MFVLVLYVVLNIWSFDLFISFSHKMSENVKKSFLKSQGDIANCEPNDTV